MGSWNRNSHTQQARLTLLAEPGWRARIGLEPVQPLFVRSEIGPRRRDVTPSRPSPGRSTRKSCGRTRPSGAPDLHAQARGGASGDARAALRAGEPGGTGRLGADRAQRPVRPPRRLSLRMAHPQGLPVERRLDGGQLRRSLGCRRHAGLGEGRAGRPLACPRQHARDPRFLPDRAADARRSRGLQFDLAGASVARRPNSGPKSCGAAPCG